MCRKLVAFGNYTVTTSVSANETKKMKRHVNDWLVPLLNRRNAILSNGVTIGTGRIFRTSPSQ